MQLLRWLLFPFTILYTLIIWVRNFLYDIGVFKSKTFPVNTIVVGNLAVGGAGKSPLTQMLISHFEQEFRIATLSRGYGRSTKGFRLVQPTDPVTDVGDEPLQFKKNFPNITVAVDESRAEGIEILQKDHNLIILDDAFQHRKIIGRCNILVFDYASLQKPICLLPTGNFRDTMNQTKRAAIVVISKCPPTISEKDRLNIQRKIERYNPTVKIYYSFIEYLKPVDLNGFPVLHAIDQEQSILLVTGIANPLPLIDHLNAQSKVFEHLKFPDHHNFTNTDYAKIKTAFDQYDAVNKIILTTEKDAQRLNLTDLSTYPIYYLPIRSKMEKENDFFMQVSTFVN